MKKLIFLPLLLVFLSSFSMEISDPLENCTSLEIKTLALEKLESFDKLDLTPEIRAEVASIKKAISDSKGRDFIECMVQCAYEFTKCANNVDFLAGETIGECTAAFRACRMGCPFPG